MIEEIQFLEIRHDLPGMFYYTYMDSNLMLLNKVVTISVLLITFVLTFYFLNKHLIQLREPKFFEEFPNLNRWNLPGVI